MGEGWYVSDLNLDKSVMEGKTAPRTFKIYDTTLRDGEQTIGVAFPKEDKLKIARALDAAGVQRIEAGMPIVSREDQEAAEMIAHAGLKAEVWGFCRSNVKDVQACLDAGLKAVVCEIATSEYKMKAYGLDRETIKKRMLDAVTYAKEHGLYVAFFAVDATRAPLDFLEEMYRGAVEKANADEVVIVDTLGVATPEAMAYLTRKTQEWVNVPVMTHCHNDFGLGVACTLSSVMAGAHYAHVCVNGLGEKTGNADLAEIAVAARLYGMNTGLNLKALYDLSKVVEEASGVALSPLKPVVGANVFKRESGVTVSQMVVYPPSVEGYSAEMVGRSREVLLSKKSGKASIEYMLGQFGLKASAEQVDGILAEVKALGVKLRSTVSPDQFREIAVRVIGGSRA
ncbi:MAG: LeuA family protein [Bacillota bacterium]